MCSTEVDDDSVFCDESRDGFLNACWLRKTVDCDGLWGNADIDKPAETWPPPSWPPAEMEAAFTLGGMRDMEMFRDGLLCGSKFCSKKNDDGTVPTQWLANEARTLVWNQTLLEGMLDEARRGVLVGGYGVHETNL